MDPETTKINPPVNLPVDIKEKSNNKKKIIISILIVIVLCVGGYFLYKYISKKIVSNDLNRILTKEEKVKILDDLNSTTPPNDGSVLMTQSEKMKVLNSLIKKK